MEALTKFLRSKRKSAYCTAKGTIKLSKQEKGKIKRFKGNQSVGVFINRREMTTTYVSKTLPVGIGVSSEEKSLGEKSPGEVEKQEEMDRKFIQKQRRRIDRLERQVRVEEVEDLWGEERVGSSSSSGGDQKLSRKTSRPNGVVVNLMGENGGGVEFGLSRSDIWSAVHFYRDVVRRPRLVRSEVEGLLRKLVAVKVQVPLGLELATEVYGVYSWPENLRGVFGASRGIWRVVVHGSSLGVVDESGTFPSRKINLVVGSQKERVLIRVAYISPDEKQVAILTVGEGIVLVRVEWILGLGEVEVDLEVEKSVRLFMGKTFRRGAWHGKSVYFAAILHGQVVIVNTKKGRGIVFYKGVQKIQQVEFHPVRSLLVLVGPANIFFHDISTQKRETKQTINHISGANTVGLGWEAGILYVGTGTRQVQVFGLDSNGKTQFIRAVHVPGIPRSILVHRKDGYAAVLDRTPSVLVYGNPRSSKGMNPRERAGAIHRYEEAYRAGYFHAYRPMGQLAAANKLFTMHAKVPKVGLELG
ncbi:hypothetical protein NEHOM01_1762 [Nematocida homosporus]|uniref:uncharacterized protein n=1 Tax=Nematocida homosporus TaxID=1912981 RepID=UPI002220373B|nr:uncharacterized protein NEHOM01_1762 [Nematocida homosporus]KAI5186873.1 hypothetical protein NEHOM01_1762 [Nematocida homosporus]